MKTRAMKALIALAAILAMGAGSAVAERREPRPGQPRRVRPGNVPKAGGPNCANVTEIPSSDGVVAFEDTDNTCGQTHKIEDYNTGIGTPCNTVGYSGPELIYSYEITGPGSDLTITLDPRPPADLAVLVISECGNGPSCVGYADQIGGGQVSTLRLVDQPLGSYFIYVDAYYTTGPETCGNYTLTVTGTVPVELLDFTVD